jgi:hypothetical protein
LAVSDGVVGRGWQRCGTGEGGDHDPGGDKPDCWYLQQAPGLQARVLVDSPVVAFGLAGGLEYGSCSASGLGLDLLLAG